MKKGYEHVTERKWRYLERVATASPHVNKDGSITLHLLIERMVGTKSRALKVVRRVVPGRTALVGRFTDGKAQVYIEVTASATRVWLRTGIEDGPTKYCTGRECSQFPLGGSSIFAPVNSVVVPHSLDEGA